jgi:hypothetical protein
MLKVFFLIYLKRHSYINSYFEEYTGENLNIDTGILFAVLLSGLDIFEGVVEVGVVLFGDAAELLLNNFNALVNIIGLNLTS